MPTIAISNRKYLGAKFRLLDFVLATMHRQTDGHWGVFADPFSGTGVVSDAVRHQTGCSRVIANDLLYSNYVAQKCFLASPTVSERQGLVGLLDHLNSVEPIWGYAFRNYGERYFTWDNAAKIDAIRDELRTLRERITEWQYFAALTSLLYAADRSANTVGQYDAFLKNIARPSYENGAHLVDQNALKPLRLLPPSVHSGAPATVHCEDANHLMARQQCETLYLDPPYNSRQYSDLYHVLENIARWEKPRLTGKTRKFDRTRLKSDYSRRRRAEQSLAELLEYADCRHIFLSYSDEGLMSHDTICCLLRRRGRLTVFEQAYPVFGNGAGRARNRSVTERLYHVAR